MSQHCGEVLFNYKIPQKKWGTARRRVSAADGDKLGRRWELHKPYRNFCLGRIKSVSISLTSGVRSFARYDPKENKWTRVASMSTRRLGVAVAVLGGFLYAVGGSDGTSPLNTGNAFCCPSIPVSACPGPGSLSYPQMAVEYLSDQFVEVFSFFKYCLTHFPGL